MSLPQGVHIIDPSQIDDDGYYRIPPSVTVIFPFDVTDDRVCRIQISHQILGEYNPYFSLNTWISYIPYGQSVEEVPIEFKDFHPLTSIFTYAVYGRMADVIVDKIEWDDCSFDDAVFDVKYNFSDIRRWPKSLSVRVNENGKYYFNITNLTNKTNNFFLKITTFPL